MRRIIASLMVLGALFVGGVSEVATAPPAQAATDLISNYGGSAAPPIYFVDLNGTSRILYPGWSNVGRYGIYNASALWLPTNVCATVTLYRGGVKNTVYLSKGAYVSVRDGDNWQVYPSTSYCNS